MRPNIRAALFHCPNCKYCDVAPPDASLKICLRCGFYERTNLETGERSAADLAVEIVSSILIGGALIWIIYNW